MIQAKYHRIHQLSECHRLNHTKLNRSNIQENISHKHATTNLTIAAFNINLYAEVDRQKLENHHFSWKGQNAYRDI